jgi:hypothetical protein
VARPRFIVVYQGRRIPLPDGDLVVGRGIGCHIRFNAETVSRQHLRLTVQDGKVLAENLSRTTGTMLNGSRLIGERSLTHGDELTLGPRRFRVEVEDGDDGGLDTLERASEHDGDEEVTGIRMPGEPAPARPAVAVPAQEFDFHTCPQCLARVAFRESTCARCGFAWSASDPSAVIGRVTMRDMREAAPVPAAVPVVYGSEELTIDALVVDLRRDSAFIPSELLDAPGASCELTLLPDGIFAMKIKGKVGMVRPVADAHGPAGMEVRFGELTTSARQWLDRWLAARSSQ